MGFGWFMNTHKMTSISKKKKKKGNKKKERNKQTNKQTNKQRKKQEVMRGKWNKVKLGPCWQG